MPSYKFTRNVLEMFYPIHHERICSAVDQLPNPEDFAAEPFSQQSNLELFKQNDSQLTTSDPQQTEPGLPSSRTSEPAFKKPKGKGKVIIAQFLVMRKLSKLSKPYDMT